MYRVYVYTPVGICVHEASWNPWKRGSGDRPGPPQCQKSAMKKITWSRGTRITRPSRAPISNAARAAQMAERGYQGVPCKCPTWL